MRRILSLLALCAGIAHAEVVVRDDAGNELRLPAPAKRIVSLAPHITENLFAVGAGDRVVGTVEYSDHPQAAKKITRIGGFSRFDLEAVVALRPDLVIAWQSGNRAAQVERLRGIGLPVFVTQPNRIEDVAADLERLGMLAGTQPAADAASAAFRTRLAALKLRYSSRPAVRTFYQVWNHPIMTVGGQQIISDAIRICGGDNVFGQLTTMAPTVSEESVIVANPEAIVASGMGEARPEWVDYWRRWPQLTAATRNNLFFIPPDLIQRHTPRLLEGTERLCGFLEMARERRGH
jgi:iron complex transport system substrate-binding protein